MGPKLRFKWIDVVLILLCIGAGIYFYLRVKGTYVTYADLPGMGQYFFRRHSETGKWMASFFVLGIIATIKISFWAMIPASIVGLVFGISRTSGNLFLRMVGRSYVELVRNVPPLVLIYIFYFFVADQFLALFGVEEYMRGLSGGGQWVLKFLFAGKSLFIQFLSGILTLAFFAGAYITEIVRAGIQSIETGQRWAAHSLGLSWRDEMRFIILPQAIKVVLPALVNEYVNLIKYSSILSVVSIQELVFRASQVDMLQGGDMYATWLTVSAIYLLLTFSLSHVADRLEVRMARSN